MTSRPLGGRQRAAGLAGAVLTALTVLAAGLAGPAPGAAATAPVVLIVAASGSDAGDGTVDHPLATVQEALGRLGGARGTVRLRGGVYHQRVRVTGAHGVAIEPFRGEHVVLSGAGLRPPKGMTAMVEIRDSSAVTVRGLDITGYRTSSTSAVPVGILVHGHDEGVDLIENHVHHLGNDNGTPGSFDINAHGIAVYGDDPAASVHDLRIEGDRVDHLTLGASEAVVVNGNVERWSISGNRISDVNNIGIDAIGFEPTLSGAARYSDRNRARDGVIAHNVVRRVVSRGNPSYREGDGWCDCADGIYVDGGTRIRITGNTVDRNDIGIEVAAENARGSASRVRVERNRVTGSLFTGITTGGYCDGGKDCGGVRTGTSFDNVFADNVLRGNNRKDDGSPELLVQYGAHDDRFVRNRITATNRAHAVTGTVPRAGTGRRNVSDHDVFRAEGGSAATARFGWDGRTYRGFAAYRAATHQDRRSTFR